MITAFECEDKQPDYEFIFGDLVQVQGCVTDDNGIDIEGFTGTVISNPRWSLRTGTYILVEWDEESMARVDSDYDQICKEVGFTRGISLVDLDYLIPKIGA